MNCYLSGILVTSLSTLIPNDSIHGLRTSGEEIAVTVRPKIHFHSQIFRYSRSIFCLPHRPKFSDFFDLCLHWVSVVRDYAHVELTNMTLWHLECIAPGIYIKPGFLVPYIFLFTFQFQFLIQIFEYNCSWKYNNHLNT